MGYRAEGVIEWVEDCCVQLMGFVLDFGRSHGVVDLGGKQKLVYFEGNVISISNTDI